MPAATCPGLTPYVLLMPYFMSAARAASWPPNLAGPLTQKELFLGFLENLMQEEQFYVGELSDELIRFSLLEYIRVGGKEREREGWRGREGEGERGR